MLEDNRGVEKNIIRVEESKRTKMLDLIAIERELTIFVNKKKIISLYCSPGNYKYLGVGFLLTAGILTDKRDIVSIETKEDSININLKKSILLCENINSVSSMIEVKTKFKKDLVTHPNIPVNFKLDPLMVYKLIAGMHNKAVFFKLTGGVHSCALATRDGKILLFSEDISRYNTIDRVIGEALLTNINTNSNIMLTSCRITSGVLKKIIFGNIPIVISRAAVTDCAIKIANDNYITLIGFTRGKKMNIYTHSNRIAR